MTDGVCIRIHTLLRLMPDMKGRRSRLARELSGLRLHFTVKLSHDRLSLVQ